MTTVDYLDKRVPVPHYLGTTVFDRLVGTWQHSDVSPKTVAWQVHKATMDAVASWLNMQHQLAVTQTRALRPPRSRVRSVSVTHFVPKKPLTDTATDLPVLTEDVFNKFVASTAAQEKYDTTAFEAAWDAPDQSGVVTRAATQVSKFARWAIHRPLDVLAQIFEGPGQ